MAGLRVSEDELRGLLVQQLGVLEEAEFEKARRTAARLRIPLERALVEQGRVPQAFLLESLAQSWAVDFVDLRVADVRAEALRLLPEEYARRHLAVPFDRVDRELRVAMADPRDRAVVGEIAHLTGHRVRPHLAPEQALRRALLLYRGSLRELLDRAATEDAGAAGRARHNGHEEASAVALVETLLTYAAVARASDIHVEPYELETLVRCRIDGVLQEVLSLPPALHLPLVARIKILATMRIDERRVPQDGRIDADLGGVRLDLRVSSIPTHWGEKMVLRVLSKEAVVLDLEDLGLAPADYDAVVRGITRPYGMVLLTGPTGSGKTTSLYAMLMRIGTERQNVINISTIEEPVEYTMPRVNQMQVNPQAGVHFATGLRALLRQDPDVIMVGEIRDLETAEIAVRSALVGRLLLSTLHTNDATGAVPRLLDMGVEPYLLSSTLSLVVAQRLVRRICTACRESIAPDARGLQAVQGRPDFAQTLAVLRAQGILGAGSDTLARLRLFRGAGCPQCHGSGFLGRLGLFELFEIDDEARELIMQRAPGSALRTRAVARGMKTMFQDGLAKALLGQTTLDEVFRVAL
jgi:type IV pilus assembly protein PilB